MRLLQRLVTAAVSCAVYILAGCAINGSGSGGTPVPVNPSPVGPPPIPVTAKAKFAYTANQGASLSGYSVDTSTGALTALSGFPLTLGANPEVVAVDPQNRFLFVGDIALSELHVFTIDNSTGVLKETADSPYATVHEPVTI